jgi:hypothetical protein
MGDKFKLEIVPNSLNIPVYSDGHGCGLMGENSLTTSMQHPNPQGNNGLVGMSPHKRLGHPYQSRQPASQKKPRTSFTKAQVLRTKLAKWKGSMNVPNSFPGFPP